jgi:hypothetical protein
VRYEVIIVADRVSPIFCHRFHSKGRNSPVSSFVTSGDRNGSSVSQSRHWNLRPPILRSRKRMGLRHWNRWEVGYFWARDAHAGSGASTVYSLSPIDAEAEQ